MIQLHPDSLIFQTSQGELIPCSAETVTIELIGDASSLLDPDTVREAAAAVVHYFKNDLGRETVSVAEFSDALERALRCFGYEVSTSTVEKARVAPGTDLRDLAKGADDFELSFFPRLRDEFHRQVKESPEVVRFCGLRGCVKQLLGAKRWSQRCDRFSEQVIDFLTECLSIEGGSTSRALLVR
ncbi:MAG TPA: hypothetical protein VGR78_11800 [Verrucomicrobiae bacterium]|nr:hypothetical protein [Verrucomicrobiae bacterium]